MVEKTWLDYATALGSIATPIFVLFLTGIGWKLKSANERRVELENQLREDRIKTYNQILEPFIIAYMNEGAWKKDKKYNKLSQIDFAISIINSLEYRESCFKLALMAPDSLVKSFNNLLQNFFNTDLSLEKDKLSIFKITVELFGDFLIEIRKSMGNENTKLEYWDMCEFWMTDVRKLKNGTLVLE